MMNRDNPVWLITGCSTGFGRELAKLVLERGWRAVVTARDPSKVKDIAEAHGDRALVLPLDDKAVRRIPHRQPRRLFAFAQRVRLRVQPRGVHRVHQIVDDQ